MEIWFLVEQANNAIPPEIRQQFQCDKDGHVLFFTSPPLDVKGEAKRGEALGHSARYLARMKGREEAKKRKRGGDEDEVNGDGRGDEPRKIAKIRQGEVARKVAVVAERAREAWERQMQEGTERELRALYADGWRQRLEEQQIPSLR